jgi:uncharacterized alpha-E superfamily protein
MIGRIAEALFWIGRYAERIDCHARLINASFHTFQEWNGCKEERSKYWQNVINILGDSEDYLSCYPVWDEVQVLHFITMDATHPNSIASCLANARHNVRSVRDRLPGRLWECINDCHLWLQQQESQETLTLSPYMFYREINNRMALFDGIAHSGMLRQNEWHLMQMGKYIERVDNTFRLLKMEYDNLQQAQLSSPAVYQKLLSVLQAVDGFEACRKFHADNITPDNVFDFLLANPVFPRSILFSFHRLEAGLLTLQSEDPAFSAIIIRTKKMMQKIKVTLTGLDHNLYSSGQLPDMLVALLRQCNELGEEIGSTFFREGTHIT